MEQAEQVIDPKQLENKVKRAIVQLMIQMPFFASLLLRARVRFDPNIATVATEARDVFCNPKHVIERDKQDLTYDLCEAVMHKVWLHPLRRNGRDLKRWNKACTYAISSFLKQSGIKLASDALYDSKYDDIQTWTADSIYVDLIKREKNDPDNTPEGHQPGSGFADGSPDHLLDNKFKPDDGKGSQQAPRDQSQMRQLEDEMKQQMAGARQMQKQAGNVPESIDKVVSELLKPKQDWKARLRQFMQAGGKDDVTWRRPNRRLMAHGIYMPIQESEQMPNMALLFDTSGSIYANEETLKVFMTEIRTIREDLNPKQTTIIQCDAKVAAYNEFAEGEELEFDLKGGGGTRFSPAFDAIVENDIQPEVIVYFTDLYSDDFGPDPGIPVLWAVYDNDEKMEDLEKRVPFGDIIRIDPKDEKRLG